MSSRTTLPGLTTEDVLEEYRHYSSQTPVLYNSLMDRQNPQGYPPGSMTRLVDGEMVPVVNHVGQELARRYAELHEQILATATVEDNEDEEAEAAGKNKKNKGKKAMNATKAATEANTNAPKNQTPTLHIPLATFQEYTSLLHDAWITRNTNAAPANGIQAQPAQAQPTAQHPGTAALLHDEELLTAQLLSVWRQGYAAAYHVIMNPLPPLVDQQQMTQATGKHTGLAGLELDKAAGEGVAGDGNNNQRTGTTTTVVAAIAGPSTVAGTIIAASTTVSPPTVAGTMAPTLAQPPMMSGTIAAPTRAATSTAAQHPPMTATVATPTRASTTASSSTLSSPMSSPSTASRSTVVGTEAGTIVGTIAAPLPTMASTIAGTSTAAVNNNNPPPTVAGAHTNTKDTNNANTSLPKKLVTLSLPRALRKHGALARGRGRDLLARTGGRMTRGMVAKDKEGKDNK